jgi:hypothetical protein
MTLADINKREFVERAIEECEALGRERFLEAYGFERARRYFLRFNGQLFDSKAVLGVAHRYAMPEQGVLQAADFSGGIQTVVRRLRSLNFEVVDAFADSPRGLSPALVLVENETTYGGSYDHWSDVTGVEYHFPNQYRNKVTPGRPFLYYRGVRRFGGVRGAAEYFGVGRIGQVWPDADNAELPSRRNWTWHCEVVDYVPFSHPVVATENGVGIFEDIDSPLAWRNGVREVASNAFEAVLAEAGVDWLRLTDELQTPGAGDIDLPPLDTLRPQATNIGIEALRGGNGRTGKPGGTGATTPGRSSRRRSKHAKLIGDRAETVVRLWLTSQLDPSEAATLRHVADEGEYPGWDIEYQDNAGRKHCIEVKGTSGGSFPSVELTDNEWRAAKSQGEHFWLYLVTHCLSRDPKIACLKDPFARCAQGELLVAPSVWTLSRP